MFIYTSISIMSKPLIAGNWKMHLSEPESRGLAEQVEAQAAAYTDTVETAVFPSSIALSSVNSLVESTATGVQNIYFADEGAFTGEIAAAQVSDVVDYAIVGHSERRYIFGETDETVARKTAACIRNHITPIVCVGETLHERQENETVQVLNDQISTGLTMITSEDVAGSVIAYEPVWAIGTGENAKPEDVASAARTIDRAIGEMFGRKTADQVRVLYGGSVSSETAGSYLDLEEISGLLVGGASLKEHEFKAIIERAANGGAETGKS